MVSHMLLLNDLNIAGEDRVIMLLKKEERGIRNIWTEYVADYSRGEQPVHRRKKKT